MLKAKQRGSSFVELLITVAMTLATIATVGSELLILKQENNQLNDVRIAEQALNNIAQELTLTHQNFSTQAFQDWQQQIRLDLPFASLKLQPRVTGNHLEMQWPTRKTLGLGCQDSLNHTTCVAL